MPAIARGIQLGPQSRARHFRKRQRTAEADSRRARRERHHRRVRGRGHQRENTVDTEGCKAEATITQLNLVAKTLDGATDSLNASLKSIQEKNAETALQDPKADSDGAAAGQSSNNPSGQSNGASSNSTSSNGTSDTKSSDESKKELQQSIDKADKLVDKLSKDDSLTLTGRKLLSALSKAADSGQKLVESGNIKDSKYYKAAKITLDEAIDMADNWVNSQAAKAQ